MDNGLIMMVVGGILLVAGAVAWQKGNYLSKNGKKTSAIVFGNNVRRSRGSDLYYPVVRFLTDKQEWITEQLNMGFTPALKEGTRIQVIYDPEEPSHVVVNSKLRLRIMPPILVAIGVTMLLIGALKYLELIGAGSE